LWFSPRDWFSPKEERRAELVMVPLRSQMCAALAVGLTRRCLSPAPDRGFARALPII